MSLLMGPIRTVKAAAVSLPASKYYLIPQSACSLAISALISSPEANIWEVTVLISLTGCLKISAHYSIAAISSSIPVQAENPSGRSQIMVPKSLRPCMKFPCLISLRAA